MKRIAKFEKVSFEQFQSGFDGEFTMEEIKEMYANLQLPKRATKNSCGYDFFAIEDMILHPGEIKKIPTGYKAKFNADEMLMLVVRSSMGFKYNVRMCNQVGIFESDYYNNETNKIYAK